MINHTNDNNTIIDVDHNITIAQIVPALNNGGVERGVVDLAKEIKSCNYRSIVISSGGILLYQLKEAGIEHFELKVNSKNPWIIWQNSKKIAELIKKENINILHIRSRAPMISAYLAAKTHNVKLVSTIHGSYSTKFLFFQNFFLKKLYNSIMYYSDRVIAVSKFIKDLSITNYCNPAKKKLNKEKLDEIEVVHRGVDIKYFDCDKISKDAIIDLIKKWQLPEDKKIIMLPARFTSWKGHQLLLEALKKVKNDFFCIMVGSFHGHHKFYQKIAKEIANCELSGKVKIIGPTNQMTIAYALSYVVISPSTRPEAFGRIATETQSCKKLIIASNIGGSLETIINGETGFLFENNNSEDLANKIDTALSMNNQQYQEITARARNHIINNFSNQKMFQETIKIYQELIIQKDL
jgi:glycosyltransferase involved in cell wall biosynthesis